MDNLSWIERLDSLPQPFTTAMARDVGLGYKALHSLTLGGVLRRPIEGVYVDADTPDSIELRCRMLSLVVPADCFVCDRTAAWVHAGERALGPDEHLVVPPISCFRPSDGGRLRNPLSESGEREIRPDDLVEIHGVVATTPLRTALDLGRLQPTLDLRLHGMDTMLSLGQFSQEQLMAQVPRFNRRRGVVILRVLAPLADGGSESFGETSLRLRWYGAGLPRPRTQIPVEVDGVVYRLDMGLEARRCAAEYDGAAYHSTPLQRRRDVERRVMLSDHGWRIEAFRRSHVYGHRQDAERRLAAAFPDARGRLT